MNKATIVGLRRVKDYCKLRDGAHNINTMNKNFLKAVKESHQKHVQRKRIQEEERQTALKQKQQELESQQKEKEMLQEAEKRQSALSKQDEQLNIDIARSLKQ